MIDCPGLEIIGFCVASFGAGDSVVLELVEVSFIGDDPVASTLAPLSHGG